MKYRSSRRSRGQERDLQYWQQIVENRLPLVGPWFREIAARRLTQEAAQENRIAIYSLAVAMDTNPDDRVREIAAQAISAIDGTGSVNSAWEAWLETRGHRLEAMLARRSQLASNGRARVYSSLLLDKASVLSKADARQADYLLSACEDRDVRLQNKARTVLQALSNPAGVEVLCNAWAGRRTEWLDQAVATCNTLPESIHLRVLVLLRRDRISEIVGGGPEQVDALIASTRDQDPNIAARAEYCLRRLRRPAAQGKLCEIWAEMRSSQLEVIIRENGWIPHQPGNVRLLTQLILGKTSSLSKLMPENVFDLLEIARADSDPQIRERAFHALTTLANPDSRAEVCRLFIEQAHPTARKVAISAGFRPDDPAKRCLFLFLAWQWEEYSALDFDGRILRTIFLGANTELRKRITTSMQHSGRVDFLPILAGTGDSGSTTQLTHDETRLLVRMLADGKEWERLWNLALELPLMSASEIIKLLEENEWRPVGQELVLFNQIQGYLKGSFAAHPDDVRRLLPLAQAAAVVRVHGRVNDLAFSPTEPILAVGTGQRKVVLWNYQAGEIETILRGFEHSIGQVSYDKRGRLFIAERTNGDDTCAIYMWDKSGLTKLGVHEGSITAIAPLNEHLLISAGKDSRLITWAVTNQQKRCEISIPAEQYGPIRDIFVSAAGGNALLVQTRIGAISTPNLDNYRPLSRSGVGTGVRNSAPKCGVIVGGEEEIILGQHNGQVIWYRPTPHRAYWAKTLLAEHTGCVRGIEYLSSRNLLISGGSEGRLQIMAWPARKLLATITTPQEKLTSLKASPNGAFLATGYADSSMILWDLRTSDLPPLFSQPMACGKPSDLALLTALLQQGKYPPSLENSLRCLQLIIQHNLRFDVQVDELPILRPGEYDIVLDEPEGITE